MPPRSQGQVISLEVARRIDDERQQALARLARAQHDAAALREALEQHEAEHRRLQAALADTRARLAAAEGANEARAADTQAADARAAESKAEPDQARIQELLGDLANVRRRRDLDLAVGVRAELIRLLKRLADVRDSVHWALAAQPDPASPWFVGLVGIRDQIDRQLRAEGASVYGAVGDWFDPHLHQALSTEEGPASGTVLRVEAPGIRLDDGTIVRPARVAVAA